MSVVYIILNETNDRYYIGSATKLERRWSRHLYDLKNNSHHNHDMQNDYNEGHSFIISVVFESADRDVAFAEELGLINKSIDDPKCYNIGSSVRGGDNLTHNPKRSKIIERIKSAVNERIMKLTKDERKAKFGRCGKSNGMYKRTHSQETRDKISKILTGKMKGISKGPFSVAHRAKLSAIAKLRIGKKNPFYGKHHSDETRLKLSNARKGSKPANSLKVSINGVIYESLTDAGRQLGLNTTVVRWRVLSRNKKYVDWRYVDECPENIESVPRTKKEQ